MDPAQRDGGGGARAASARDEKRAAALRANLQRRKAQARGRADRDAEVKSATSSQDDRRSD